MAVAHFTSPFITIYKRSGDTFTKLANPATLPASTGNGVAFSSDDTYMAVAHSTSPFITIYKRSGDTFTKLADPATLAC
jgi:lipopolysaccharide export system protein LptC